MKFLKIFTLLILMATLLGGCRLFKDCDCPSFSKNIPSENTEISEFRPV